MDHNKLCISSNIWNRELNWREDFQHSGQNMQMHLAYFNYIYESCCFRHVLLYKTENELQQRGRFSGGKKRLQFCLVSKTNLSYGSKRIWVLRLLPAFCPFWGLVTINSYGEPKNSLEKKTWGGVNNNRLFNLNVLKPCPLYKTSH